MKKKHLCTVVILLSFLSASVQPTLAINIPTDTSVGSWDPLARVYTLTTNVTEGLDIVEGSLTLDGAGYTVTPGLDEGVDIDQKSNITVQNLNIVGDGAGISLRFSDNCTISNNTLDGCQYGIFLAGSDYNVVTGNTADQSLSSSAGIWLQQNASYNNIIGNTTKNSVNGAGIYAQDCTNNNDLANNTITNNKVGIKLVNCSNFNSSITGNDVSYNTEYGIYLFNSSGNTLTNNTVSNNVIQGIRIEGYNSTSVNTVTNNTISYNLTGVRLYNTSNNQIYNNNFISNTTYQAYVSGTGDGNVFNLSEPTGGNFWNDYPETGVYSFTGGQDNLTWAVQNGWLPMANAGADQTVECAWLTTNGTQVTLDGSGSTGASTYIWTGPFLESPASGSYPTVTLDPGCLGEYVINLVVNNGQYDSDPDTVTITVVDTTPPDITPPGDVTIEAMGPDPVQVDDERIQAFLAGVSASDNCDPEPAITNDAPSEFPTGKTIVNFTATDASGNSSTCLSTVIVVEAAESSLRIIPSIINRDGLLQNILAVVRFPEGTTEQDIDIDTPLVLYPGDSPNSIEAINQRIVTWYRCGTLRVSVFASFPKDEVTAGVPENGPAELMVIGRFESGQYFYGFDNVWICSWNW